MTIVPQKQEENRVIMEPIITISKTIRPKMSKQSEDDYHVSEEKEQLQKENASKEESVEDISSLINSAQLLTECNSQLTPERKAEILQTFLFLSKPTFNLVAKSIDFTTWPEDVVSDLCKEMQSMDLSSNSVPLLLLKSILYPKIASLKTSASRLLMNGILSLAREQGKLIINGLLLPLLFQSSLERPQFEVINKTAMESLKPAHRLVLLQAILSDGEMYHSDHADNRRSLRPWNDTIYQLIGNILSCQPLLTLTKEALDEIIQSIRTTVGFNPKDKNSMQLLLTITSKHAQEVVEFDCIETIESISNSSKMFLKRAVLGQIAVIKKNIQSLQNSRAI
ncbi:unnamed protein product [Rhizopus microsporus]